MALFRILKGNEVNLPEKKREGFAYFTVDENDFYIDTESSTTDAAGKESGGARKQLNANRAHYLKSKNINKNNLFDQLYIDDEEISLGRKAGESNYENAYNANVVTSAGMKSIAVGYAASATGNYSSSFGSSTVAEGIDSHAQGRSTIALGEASHAEGVDTQAIGDFSHAEGDHTIASGDKSHAGGYYSSTNGKIGAFVHGLNVVANAEYQTIFGKYSNALTTDAFVIGNGTADNNRSNIFSVDWDGHATLKDSLLIGRDPVLDLEVATKQYVDVKISAVEDDKLFSYTTQLTADSSTIEFNDSKIDVNKCLVYYNGLLLILGENYTITDEKTIQLTDWIAKSGDFFVVTGKQSNNSSSGSLDVGTVGSPTRPVYFNNGVPVACDLAFAGNSYLYSKLAGQNGISSITFNNNSNIDVHNCLVYCNGLLLVPGENYTITNNSTISLVGWTAEADDLFIIVSNQLSTSGNDYAEYRLVDAKEPGRCVIEDESGVMKLSTKRLQPGAEIISDTYGMLIGKQNNNQIPIASSGRVLAYPAEDRNTYSLGCAVCSGPNGTVSQMTREEIKEYPERIIGTVSEIPKYETWGDKNIKVNGRIWIRIR